MMKEEMGRNFPEANLPGCYDRLIKLISRLDDSVGGAHADWKEIRANHDRIQMPSASSSVKSANLKVIGFSKISESV
jgi:hypothetical protein